MKNRKMFAAALAVVGAVAMCGSAFAQDTTQTTTTTTTTPAGTTMTQSTTYVTDANRLSVSDMIFLQDLMHANAEEIALSRIAVHHADSKGVSDYAQMMINDHEALQNQLMSTYSAAPWMSSWREDMRHRARMNNVVGMDYYNDNTGVGYENHDHRMDHHDMDHHDVDNQGGHDSGAWDNWMILDGSDWEKVRWLRSLNGYEFDKQYVATMVQDHDKLLRKIWKANDMTSNSDIKSLANTVQGTVNNHLEEGRMISFNYDDPFGINRSWPWVH